MTTISTVVGEEADAGLERRVAEEVLHVDRHEEEHPQHPERDDERDRVGAEEVAVCEERNWTIGARTRSSIATNAASPAAPPTNSPTTAGEPQPHELPSISASTSAVNAAVRTATPGKSITRSIVRSRDSRTANSVAMTATTATGRLMKKIALQETCSTRNPPTNGPIESANAETPAQVPIALPRSAGVNALVMIESVAGIISAAPVPCRTRLAISISDDAASPAVAEESAKMMTPAMNIRRRPKMSPRRPPVTSRTPNESV